MAKMRNIKFINYKLSEKQKKEFAKWSDTAGQDTFEYLKAALYAGHKLSLSHNQKDGTCFASFTCVDDNSVNRDCCLTSRHSDPIMAMLIGIYKVLVVLEGQEWSKLSVEDDWG